MGDIVVGGDQVAAELDDPGVVLVDVRPPHFYQQAHLPGAVNLPVFYLFAANAGPPAADDLVRRLGRLGISRSTRLVAYDDGASASAARLYWVLKYYRHPDVSVLDGGVTAWRHEGRDWEYTAVEPEPAEYEIPDPDPTVLTDLANVSASLGAPDSVIVDTRSPAEYLGLQRTARRNGHIPGAINIDWSNNLTLDEGVLHRLRSDDELRDLYQTSGVTPDKDVILHCETGNRASETFLVLKKLGYPRVALYTAGWQEWGNRDDTPVEEA